jgi:hypothetical protein
MSLFFSSKPLDWFRRIVFAHEAFTLHVGAAAVAVSAYGAYSANENASAARDQQQQALDASKSSADQATALNRDKFNWDKQVYENDIRPAQQRAQELQSRIGEESLAASQQQRQFATDQKKYYEDTFQPIERQMVDEAKNYDSQANVDRRSGIAAANVNQQFSNARGQSARLAGRYGLGSTAFSGPAGASERAQALGTAGATTGAAFDTMDKGIALRAGAANFGRNMANTAATFSAVGNQSAGVASGAGTAGLNSAITGANFMNSAYQQNIGNTLGIGAGLSSAYQNAANASNASAANWGKFAGGLYGMSQGGGSGGGGSPSIGGSSIGGWWGTSQSGAQQNEIGGLGSNTWNPMSDYNTGANGWGNYGE